MNTWCGLDFTNVVGSFIWRRRLSVVPSVRPAPKSKKAVVVLGGKKLESATARHIG